MVVIHSSSPDLSLWAREKIGAVRWASREAMDETVQVGASSMEYSISTRGTAKSGKRGRIDTGDMLQSVDSRVAAGGDRVVGEFGWLDREPGYAPYQEYGTEFIEPMLALTDAQEDAEREFKVRFESLADRV